MTGSQTCSSLRMTQKLRRRAVIAFLLSVLMSGGTSRWAASQTAPGTAALPRLSYAGTELTPVTVDPANVDIGVTVDLAGDRPMASYMAARPRGLPALQRTPTGVWVAWDQKTQSLVDNRFAWSGGHLVFAVNGANFRGQSFPIALEIAYRTPAGVKFGVLTMTSKR
jgi:hypothetical protein